MDSSLSGVQILDMGRGLAQCDGVVIFQAEGPWATPTRPRIDQIFQNFLCQFVVYNVQQQSILATFQNFLC